MTTQQNQNDAGRQQQGQQAVNTTSDQPAGPGASPSSKPMSPGDEAPAGTPGTGENVCPACGGSGKQGGNECTTCSGTGKVTTGIGGA